MNLVVRSARFADLSPGTLYALLRLRAEIFVVEQRCAYQDLDGRDTEPGTDHVWIEDAEGPVAYLRVLREPGFPEGPHRSEGRGEGRSEGSHRGEAPERDGIMIGRVCTRADARGGGAAGRLLDDVLRRYAGVPTALNAQSVWAGFYARRGFVVTGPEFVEDGIPHRPMALPAIPSADVPAPGADVPAPGAEKDSSGPAGP